MTKASPLISAMNAGEWSSLLDGRTDIGGYAASASVLENFLCTSQGPIVRRAGSEFVFPAETSAYTSRLIPFIKAQDDAVVIEFGENAGGPYCRFMKNRAPILTGTTTTITGATQADPVVITSVAHGYSNGDYVYITGVLGMTELNDRWYIVSNSAANTYELTSILGNDVDGTGYTAYVSGGTADTPYQIASPYGFDQLSSGVNIDYVQSGDVLYLTDRTGALEPRKLSRTSDTSWAFSTLDPDEGPWLPLNDTSTTIYASAATGSITLTASASIFTADDVGSIIRIEQETLTSTNSWETGIAYAASTYIRSQGKEYFTSAGGTSGTSIPAHTSGSANDGNPGVTWDYTSPGYGIARITAQAGTTATATVLTTFPQTLVGAGNASVLWRKGAWSDVNGYPTVVSFYRERLCFGQGQTIHTSKVGDFENFAIDDFGEVITESAITVDVLSSEANQITGLTEGQRLLVTTAGAEFAVEPQATSSPFGPNNIRVSQQTSYGSAPIKPIRIDETVLFAQSSQKKVRAAHYRFETDNYSAGELTVRNPDILGTSGIVQMASQKDPREIIWIARGDGQLAALTFDPTQEVRGWSRVTDGASDGKYISVVVIPSPDGFRDDVWVITQRRIDGATRRYIEYFTPEVELNDTVDFSTYVDSLRQRNAVPTTSTIYGLDHLEGETVSVIADGAQLEDKVIANGEIDISENPSSVVTAGLKYKSTYQSNRLNAGAMEGTAQGKTKRITDCVFRFRQSLGGSAGPEATDLDIIPDLNYRDPATGMGDATPLFSGDALLPWPGGYETEGYIRYENDTVFPVTMVAIMPQVRTNEDR